MGGVASSRSVVLSIVLLILVFIDFVTDHAPDDRAADRTSSASMSQQRTTGRTGACTDRGIAIAFGHVCARARRCEQRGNRNSHSDGSNIHMSTPFPWRHGYEAIPMPPTLNAE